MAKEKLIEGLPIPTHRSNLNFVLHKSDQETPTGPLMTIPDQAITVRELLIRYTTGQALPGGNNIGEYDDDPEHDDPDYHKIGLMDQMDRSDMLKLISEQKQKAENQLLLLKQMEDKQKEDERRQAPPAKARLKQDELGGEGSEADDNDLRDERPGRHRREARKGDTTARRENDER